MEELLIYPAIFKANFIIPGELKAEIDEEELGAQVKQRKEQLP